MVSYVKLCNTLMYLVDREPEATAETVKLGPTHEPKEESIKAFKEIEHSLKKQLVHLRHEHDSMPVLSRLFPPKPPDQVSHLPLTGSNTNPEHEPEYFAAVAHLSDAELASFTEADLTAVRVGTSAYGIHVFGKVRLPAMPESGPAFIHIRMYSPGTGDEAKLHCIHTEEKEEGGKVRFRAVFTKDDPLEWFDT